MLASLDVPSSTQAALVGPDGKEWRAAIDKELAAIESFGTYTLHDETEMPKGTKPIGARLVLAVKRDPTGGNNHKLKARLCAKGFTQRPGIEYTDTFSPTGHRQSFRQFMSIVASSNLEVKGFDVSSAFLHGELEEEVWMRFPKEVATEHRAGKIARLRKSLYGLKQAGKCWNDRLDKWLKGEGWTANATDACLYTLRNSNGAISLMLYLHVDDSAIAGHHECDIDVFAQKLDKQFPCTRQGNLRHFLGMEIHRDRSRRTLWITQSVYTERILHTFGMQDANPLSAPLSPSSRLEKGSAAEHAAAAHLPYRELIGSLQYLATMTRPDIAFAVSKLGSFNSCWTQKHFDAGKGLLRYIVGTRKYGIALGGSDVGLVGYVDADHQGCLDSRRSTTGWAVVFKGGLIGWKSKRQNTISHSTAESEIMALDDIARDIVWERRAFEALGIAGVGDRPTHINIDNRASVDLAKNRTSHDSTKHIHSRYLWVRELIGEKIVDVQHIAGTENPADIFTKPLPRDTLQKHLRTLRIEEPQTSD
jgi:hypothetical protein